MKNQVVADGYRRVLRGKQEAWSESVEEKYAAELANVNPRHTLLNRRRMVDEYPRRGKIEGHKPSAGTLK